MKRLLKSCFVIAIFTIVQVSSVAQVQNVAGHSIKANSSGAEVNIFTNSGIQINGELLSVREKSLMILNSSSCQNNIRWWECVDQIKKDDIQKLTIEGDSYVWAGLGIGAVLGLVSLLVTVDWNPGGNLNIPKYTNSEGVTIGVFLGCITAGGIIGLLTSTQDEVIEPFSEYDIKGLSDYAKYPEDEPRILNQIE